MRFASFVLVCLTVMVSAGCSDQASPPTPTGPTPPTAQNIDLTGRWVRYDQNSVAVDAWQLVQSGTTVQGTPFVHPDEPVPSVTELTGSLTGSEFTFSGVTTTHWPDRQIRTTVSGMLTVMPDRLTGRMTFVPSAGRPTPADVTYFRVLTP